MSTRLESVNQLETLTSLAFTKVALPPSFDEDEHKSPEQVSTEATHNVHMGFNGVTTTNHLGGGNL
jgi:hypothetical protein